ncbi:MAG: cupin domain-containing protein [bacterium]|nr:cupin domain-containing protein [bacterium]
MFVKKLKDCQEFIAGDGCRLREILHPDKQKLDLGYSLAYAEVKRGQVTKLHALSSSEVYYIIAGNGKMYIDDEVADVSMGDTIYIPSNSQQSIENIGESVLSFICIVDPAWRIEDESVF